ncbi:MAG TPA: cytosine deaminase [Xanthobacteraceae bacterium]|jgi:cytosine deaminase|nr:cytosine deaminase [Xanthobacteraceae bacterium]
MPIVFSEITWPTARSYWLADARVPACLLAGTESLGAPDGEGVVHADLLIGDGKITRVETPAGSRSDGIARIDLGGRQVWPTLVDIHTHLDKGHTVARSPNPDGTFHNARLAAAADRPNWTEADLRRRVEFGLRCAYAYGVSAIRSHIDTYQDTAERSWKAVSAIRDEWRGKVDLQMVALCPIDLLTDDFGDKVAKVVSDCGGLLGGVTRASIGNHGAPMGNIDALLDHLFMLAKRHDLNVDLHVDETHDPAAATLPLVARAALRRGYKGRVVCGHCCSLANQPEAEVDRTLDLVAEAEIAIITLPTVNMYLQDRTAGRTPRWRGVTVVHEMRKRGIQVAAAGDNCRDSFYAYGDHDVLDTFREAVRILHFDHPLTGAPALVASTPAAFGGFVGHGRIATGEPARLIVLNARTLNEIVCRPQSDRVVIDRGEVLKVKAPDYSELWDGNDAAPVREPALARS